MEDYIAMLLGLLIGFAFGFVYSHIRFIQLLNKRKSKNKCYISTHDEIDCWGCMYYDKRNKCTK